MMRRRSARAARYSSRATLRMLALCAALSASVGCGGPEPTPFAVIFTVKADEKVPVAGAQLLARGGNIGATDAGGELKVTLDGFEGDRLPIKLQCPDGYAATPPDSIVILRSIQGLNGRERQPVTLDLSCQPSKRDAVVLVHAGGEAKSLPVKIDGAVVGKTDSLGFAHLHLSTDPGSRFEVSLDTSSNDKLMPQNPKQGFQMDQKDELFIFDQSFKLPPKPKVHRKPPPAKHIPQRLN
jgi:hypothetical protein